MMVLRLPCMSKLFVFCKSKFKFSITFCYLADLVDIYGQTIISCYPGSKKDKSKFLSKIVLIFQNSIFYQSLKMSYPFYPFYHFSWKDDKITYFPFSSYFWDYDISFPAQVIPGLSGRVISYPPPKKKRAFWGRRGMIFWVKILNFLNLGDIKNFGRTWELSGPYRPHFGRFSADCRPTSAENPHLKFQKYGIFEHFRGILETFFFKTRILTKIAQKWFKMVLMSFFRS